MANKGMERWLPVVALGGFAAWMAFRGKGAASPLPQSPGQPAGSAWRPPAPPEFLPLTDDQADMLLQSWSYPYIPGVANVSRDNPALSDYVSALSAVLAKRRTKSSNEGAAGDLYWDPTSMYAYYTPNTLRQVVLTAAGYYQIPAEWIWGQLWAESKRDPRARWFGGSASAAINAGTTALGIAGETRTQFERERAAGGTLHNGLHALNVVPHMAIWRMAEAMRRGAEAKGDLLTPDEVVWFWEEGSTGGPKGAGNHIKKYGPSVYKPDKSEVYFGADVPPWMNIR